MSENENNDAVNGTATRQVFGVVVEVVVEVEAADECAAREVAHDYINDAGYRVDAVYVKYGRNK